MSATLLLADLIVLLLAPCMIKLSWLDATDHSNGRIIDKNNRDKIFTSVESLLFIYLIGLYGLIAIVWFESYHLTFFFGSCFLIAVFLPYLMKPSKYRQTCFGDLYRPFNDKLVQTSLVYLIAALYAVHMKQPQIAAVCLVTYCGSSLYHLNHETMFFNLDNVFATTLLNIFMWSLIQAYRHGHDTYFLLGALGLPVAIFLIVYCGDPADIAFVKQLTGCICVRSGRKLYDDVHTLWHFASGVGPFLALHYFLHVDNQSTIALDCNSAKLPYICVLIAVIINIIGNYYGIIPLD